MKRMCKKKFFLFLSLVCVHLFFFFISMLHDLCIAAFHEFFISLLIIKQLGLEGTTEGGPVQHLDQSRTSFAVKAGFPGPCLGQILNISSDRMNNNFLTTDHIMLYVYLDFLCYRLWSLLLVSPLHTSKKCLLTIILFQAAEDCAQVPSFIYLFPFLFFLSFFFLRPNSPYCTPCAPAT